MGMTTPAIARQFFKDVAHFGKLGIAFTCVPHIFHGGTALPSSVFVEFYEFVLLGGHIKFAKLGDNFLLHYMRMYLFFYGNLHIKFCHYLLQNEVRDKKQKVLYDLREELL